MKRNTGKYEIVDTLPGEAMTVSEYASFHNITQSYIYKKIERNKANFKIVIFKTMNFIIPLTKH